ncbi:hypothetical protein MHM98_13310 [Psychrobium sp. MM17-31]|uniref:hypothetical protein n=1 Tax=Psychrobium sp. MM17-31 TaxID=2917758 RepID=UPI001EF67E4E|nr:hypothetical protein [Psychrobium sp. MM17-31]MCG7532310.1 hypothetical protein [Psychrobium sp. MM17-31]
MSSKFMNFIDKANRVIFFSGAVLVALLLAAILIIKGINYLTKSDHYNQPITVINDTKETTNIDYKKRYLTKLEDKFLFEILSDKIKIQQKENRESSIAPLIINSGKNNFSYLSHHTVNILFTSVDGSSYPLLKSHTLIADTSLKNTEKTEHAYLLSKNLYTLIPQDSNQDGFLDDEDKSDFWVSDSDGKNLKQLLKNIEHYRIIEDDTVLIKKADEFHLYYVDKDQLVQLDTTIK